VPTATEPRGLVGDGAHGEREFVGANNRGFAVDDSGVVDGNIAGDDGGVVVAGRRSV
jgi:hypothetical protein